jgi:hypothetical protein
VDGWRRTLGRPWRFFWFPDPLLGHTGPSAPGSSTESLPTLSQSAARELHVIVDKATMIYCDIVSAIYCSENSVHH